MLEKLFGLKGKTAIVTGGSRGLGVTFVKALAAAGAHVVIASRNLEKCLHVLEEIQADGAQGMALQLDVTDEDNVKDVVSQVIQRFGRIDILVNNAGISPFMAPLEKTRISGYNKIMNVNVTGALLCSQAVFPYMAEQGQGSIINISSSSAAVCIRGLGAYSVSKCALLQLTRNLANEWGAFNIRVNAIAPGFMEVGLAEQIQDPEPFLATVKQSTPMRRTGTSAELVGALLYFASDASSYTTGQTLFIDGGAASC